MRRRRAVKRRRWGYVIGAHSINRCSDIDRRRCVAKDTASETRYIDSVVPTVIYEIDHPVAGTVTVAMTAPVVGMFRRYMHVERLPRKDTGVAHDGIWEQ